MASPVLWLEQWQVHPSMLLQTTKPTSPQDKFSSLVPYALYLFLRALEACWRRLERSGYARSIPNFSSFLFALGTGTMFYAYTLEPDSLRPSYRRVYTSPLFSPLPLFCPLPSPLPFFASLPPYPLPSLFLSPSQLQYLSCLLLELPLFYYDWNLIEEIHLFLLFLSLSSPSPSPSPPSFSHLPKFISFVYAIGAYTMLYTCSVALGTLL